MKFCVVTTVPAGSEPRAPRHAIAAKQAFPDARVVFVDLAPAGGAPPDPPGLEAIERRRVTFPTRQRGALALALRKLRVKAARRALSLTGQVAEALFGDRVVGLTKVLQRERADVYFAHSIECLVPAALAAQASGGLLMFDCMEYYADMGDSQSAEEARAAGILQHAWLGRCALITASSEALAAIIEAEYAAPRPLALYNTPPLSPPPPAKARDGLDLYWRNAVVGFGQRGLDDVLAAMTLLPADVRLHVQGKAPTDGGAQLAARVAELGLEGRVTVLPPFAVGQAVAEAQKHSVGLCLERRGPANHEYTVSNKMFDYMMGGLAVVSADLPGLRAVIEASGGGLLFEPGSVEDLARQIRRLRDEPDLLPRLAANARAYAESVGNIEVDMARFRTALQTAVQARSGLAARGAGG